MRCVTWEGEDSGASSRNDTPKGNDTKGAGAVVLCQQLIGSRFYSVKTCGPPPDFPDRHPNLTSPAAEGKIQCGTKVSYTCSDAMMEPDREAETLHCGTEGTYVGQVPTCVLSSESILLHIKLVSFLSKTAEGTGLFADDLSGLIDTV